MPSELELATVSDYRAAFHDNVRAKRDARADGHDGSAYDYVAGVSAILLAREEAYARDLFRGKYFDDAEGDDLTDYVETRYGILRIKDTYGPGTMTLARPNAAAGGDTIWAGTRIRVWTSATTSVFYQVASDTRVSSTALYVAGVPIRATTYGAGVAVDTIQASLSVNLEDPIWDPSFTVTSLRCADGTVFEKAADYRARVLSTLEDQALGYEPAIVAACQDAGAANVKVFGTNTGGADLHACAVYVGDASFGAEAQIIPTVGLALEGARMLGAQLVLGTMQRVDQPVAATIQLYDDPSKFDLPTLAGACEGAIRRVFGATGAYGYDLDALFGAVVETTDAIQDVIFSSPDPGLGNKGVLVNGWFPPAQTSGPLQGISVLNRYVIPPGGVTFTFVGPNGS